MIIGTYYNIFDITELYKDIIKIYFNFDCYEVYVGGQLQSSWESFHAALKRVNEIINNFFESLPNNEFVISKRKI